MGTESFLSLLQFSDGLFPAGAYAHSFGLEYYVQCGQVCDADGVANFIRANLEGSLAPTETVAMLAALRCAVRPGDLARISHQSREGRGLSPAVPRPSQYFPLTPPAQPRGLGAVREAGRNEERR